MEIAVTTTEPSTALSFELVREHLYAFNVATTGIGDGKLFEVVARAGAALVGAAAGHTWGSSSRQRARAVLAAADRSLQGGSREGLGQKHDAALAQRVEPLR